VGAAAGAALAPSYGIMGTEIFKASFMGSNKTFIMMYAVASVARIRCRIFRDNIKRTTFYSTSFKLSPDKYSHALSDGANA
jgi:NurA-like 5'-3' nuclease